jgi:hypothetical protein
VADKKRCQKFLKNTKGYREAQRQYELLFKPPQKTGGGGSNERDVFNMLAIFRDICLLIDEAWTHNQPKSSATEYPTKPIQVIAPYAPGEGTDA